MWFKLLLSRLFKRDFTVRKSDPKIVAEVNAKFASGELVEPAGWTSNCSFHEIALIDAHGATHICCDGGYSFLGCNPNFGACTGHYGTCCSRC